MPKTPVEIETFHWKGQLRYRCPLNAYGDVRCEYNTYDPEQLKKHMIGDHVNPNEPKPEMTRNIPSSILGSNGKPLSDAWFNNPTPDPEFEFVTFKEKDVKDEI